jgi:heptaprenyl diphosphate synthase
MAASEIQQLNDRFRLPVSPRRILRKTVGKTALLFSLSLYVGAREGGRPEAVSSRLRRAGYALGMAFQLQDDLLDWVGDPAALGKPILEDLRSGIYTWPVAVAWKHAAQRTKEELEGVRKGRLTPAGLRNRWVDLGYLVEAEALVALYAARARRDLNTALAETPADLEAWNRFLEKLLDRKV